MRVKKKGKSFMKKNYHKSLYPSKADGSIPAFKTYEEEVIFWDSHDVTDFEKETEDVDIVFELDKPREASLVLRLQKAFKDQLKRIAKRKGLDVSALARMWLLEKMHETTAATSR